MNHYVLKGESRPVKPSLFFETEADVRDVRSGYRNSKHGFFQAEWLEDEGLNWTADMVREVDPEWLEEISPPRPLNWPVFGDEKIVHYLGAYYSPRIWRNYALGIYSTAQESETQFIARCGEALLRERSRELNRVREIFLRRFLELEQKLIEAIECEEGEPNERNRRGSVARVLFSKVRDDLESWFRSEDYRLLEPADLAWNLEFHTLLQEKLADLQRELISTYNRINAHFIGQAGEVELYDVSLSHLQIAVLSRGILWAAEEK